MGWWGWRGYPKSPTDFWSRSRMQWGMAAPPLAPPTPFGTPLLIQWGGGEAHKVWGSGAVGAAPQVGEVRQVGGGALCPIFFSLIPHQPPPTPPCCRSSRSAAGTSAAACSGRWRCSTSARAIGMGGAPHGPPTPRTSRVAPRPPIGLDCGVFGCLGLICPIPWGGSYGPVSFGGQCCGGGGGVHFDGPKFS